MGNYWGGSRVLDGAYYFSGGVLLVMGKMYFYNV